MKQIIKYEFSIEDKKVLADVAWAIQNICDKYPNYCDNEKDTCPFTTLCPYYKDNTDYVLSEAIKRLPDMFEHISEDVS